MIIIRILFICNILLRKNWLPLKKYVFTYITNKNQHMNERTKTNLAFLYACLIDYGPILNEKLLEIYPLFITDGTSSFVKILNIQELQISSS